MDLDPRKKFALMAGTALVGLLPGCANMVVPAGDHARIATRGDQVCYIKDPVYDPRTRKWSPPVRVCNK